MRREQGFTLVELLVVIAVLGILVLIAIPWFVAYLDAVALRTDQANLRTLNTMSEFYRVLEGGYILGEEVTDAEGVLVLQQTTLVDQNYLQGTIQAKRAGYSFVWDREPHPNGRLRWFYSKGGQLVWFSFNGEGHTSIGDIDWFRPRHGNRGWTIDAGGLQSTWEQTSDNILYMDVGLDIGREYTINVTAAINDGPGYGVLFDTTGASNQENGYSLQYERYGGGRIIIRPRVNGNERFGIDALGGPDDWESHFIYSSLSEGERTRLHSGETRSPVLDTYVLTLEQQELLEAEHTLRLVVRDNNGRRTLDVYLGEERVIEGFEYDVADHGNPMEQSGLRVWHNAGAFGHHTRFTSFDIE